MYRCPVCASRFEREVAICPADGSRLAPPDLPAGTLVAGRFRIDGRLEPDPVADVYRARSTETGAPVILRVFGPGAAPDAASGRRFRQNSATLASFAHPNAARVVDSGIAPVVGPFLVTEMPDGVSLAEWLARSGALKAGEAAAVIRAACYALQAAHDAGIFHGRLTAERLFIELPERGPAVTVDGLGVVGLAEGGRLGAGGDTAAPEAAPGGRTVFEGQIPAERPTKASHDDVEALGRLLFEAVAGAAPSDSVGATTVERTLSSTCPPWFVAAAAWALSADRSARFQTAAELARALRPPAPGEADFTTAAAATGTLETAAPAVVFRTNLPQPITSFVGRRAQVAAVGARLAEARLVTLSGPGGIGKTRLGLAVAGSLRFRFGDGVWFVELGPLADPELVAPAIAAAIGLREEPGVPIADTLLAALRNRETLLLLDNCEHVAGAVATLTDRILRTCPRVWVLATSRESLGVEGEALWEVPTLSLPEPGEDGGEGSEAVRLFVDRARASAPKFELTEKNAAAVAEICRRLEGLPLALELAAARMRMLSVEQLLERLTDRFRLLTGGGRTRPLRQQTLRAAIDWSYDLLSEQEREAFSELSLFADGWTLEAAEAVSAIGPGGALLDVLGSLADKSLIRMGERAGEARYRMLETVREYAAEKLKAAAGGPSAGRRYLAWAVGEAESFDREASGPDIGLWMARIAAEHDNLRCALERACETGDAESALRMVGALYLNWNLTGYIREGRAWCERALAIEGDVPPVVRGKAMLGYGVTLEQLGERQLGRDALRDSVELFRQAGARHELAFALSRLGPVEARLGRHDEAAAPLAESLDLSLASGDEHGVANALFAHGYAAYSRGEYELAAEHYERSVEIYRRLGHLQRIASVLHNLANLRESQGRLEEAEAFLDESIAIAEAIGFDQLIALSRGTLAEVVLAQGNVRRAFELYTEALRKLVAFGDRTGIAYTLEGCACAAAAAGDAWAALRLAGAAEALREVLGTPGSDDDRATLAERLAPAREALGDEYAQRELQIGRSMDLDNSIAYARERAGAFSK